MIRRMTILVASAAALSLLVAVSSVAPAGSSTKAVLQAGTTSGTADCESVTTCYTPQQLEVAYGVNPLLQRGIDGRGETVVLPELAESQLLPPTVSDLRRDFVAFDHLFHLPAPTLRFISTFPHPAHPWYAFGEEVLDVEVVHAIAPRAALTILLVKGNSLNDADNAVAASVAALRLGASAGGVISLSPAGQIGGEHCVTTAQVTQLNAALVNDAAQHVTVVAASGDVGAAGEPCALITVLGGNGPGFTPMKEVSLVTSDPLVLSVGGTTLDASHRTGPGIARPPGASPTRAPIFRRRVGDSAISLAGPPTRVVSRGSVQRAAFPTSQLTLTRTPGFHSSRAMLAVDIRSAGTPAPSASAPLWAGIVTLADQFAKRHLGFVNPAVYQIALGSHYHQAFHDITVGNNTAEFPQGTIAGYQAGVGWDPVTGWGSPNADVLVPLLARDASG